MDKHEKIIVLGKSGSGKDYLMRKLVEKGLKQGIKSTTRPPRKFEVNGIHYNFINESTFNNLLSDKKFIVNQSFIVTPENSNPQTWLYGITKEEFENGQVFIMTPGEFKMIPQENRKKCFVVYLDIDRKVREQRLFKREDKNDSVTRRMDSDEVDFIGLNDYDLKITDPEFTAEEVYDLMF